MSWNVETKVEGEKEGEKETKMVAKTRLPMKPGTTKFDLGYVDTKG